MSQTNDICSGERPSGARRPGAGRIPTRPTRVRVSSDAVVSAYIRDVARPRAGASNATRTPLHRARAERPARPALIR
jgi:hypothetical protein